MPRHLPVPASISEFFPPGTVFGQFTPEEYAESYDMASELMGGLEGQLGYSTPPGLGLPVRVDEARRHVALLAGATSAQFLVAGATGVLVGFVLGWFLARRRYAPVSSVSPSAARRWPPR